MVARSEEDFAPGAKYHIRLNAPYTRYFLSCILQFRCHRAPCATAAQIEAAASTEHFQPLMGGLAEQNNPRQCGWE